MAISTEEDAKLFAAFAISGHDAPSVIAEMLASLEADLEDDDEVDDVEVAMMDYVPVQEWLNLKPLEHGSYELGIDRLMFQLIEKRAAAFALMNTSTKIDGNGKADFLTRWMVGIVDSVFSAIDTLNSTQTKDMSLRNLLDTVRPFMRFDDPLLMEELRFIEAQLQSGHGYPGAEERLALCSPHAFPPHNSHIKTWDALDTHIQIWARVWGIIGVWCEARSDFAIEPASVTFKELEEIFSLEDLQVLEAKYDEYVDSATKWQEIRLPTQSPAWHDPSGAASGKL